MKGLMGSLAVAVLLFGLVAGAEAYSIGDDVTGGDCTQIGVWDAATKTCTMTTDLYNLSSGLTVESDGITLNGDGHTIAGPGWSGILCYGRSGVTIKNFIVTSYTNGIVIISAGNIAVINNTVLQNSQGITVQESSNVTVDSNTIANSYIGIALGRCGSNTLTNNMVVNGATRFGRSYGIYCVYSSDNAVTNNTIANHIYGFYSVSNGNNQVFNNNFIDNAAQITVLDSGGDIFNLDAPIGGNYWSNFDSPEEGCNDASGDTFCDIPYYFAGGVDNLPWTKQDGWLNPTVQIGIVETTIQEMLSAGEIVSEGTATSLTSMLDSAVTAQESGNEQASEQILGAFIKQVEAQARAGRITGDAAVQLIEAARQIR